MSTDVIALRRALSNPAALANALGLRMKRQARGVVVCCPWHDEKTPSCSVTVRGDGTIGVRCFGCNHTADALSLIAEVNGLDTRTDFQRVVEIAQGIVGGTFEVARVQAPPPEPPRLSDEIFDRIASHLAPAADDAAVSAYLRARCLDAEGLLSVPRGFDRAAIADVGREAWERSGMAGWPGHRLAIPWRRPDGVIATIQRRTLGAGEPKYVFAKKRSPRWPFGCERKPGPSSAIVFVEGALDVLAMRILAARNGRDWLVLGIPGVSNWDRSWRVFANARDAVVAIDNDQAGNEHVERIRRDVNEVATRLSRTRPRLGKDWCEHLSATERAA